MTAIRKTNAMMIFFMANASIVMSFVFNVSFFNWSIFMNTRLSGLFIGYKSGEIPGIQQPLMRPMVLAGIAPVLPDE